MQLPSIAQLTITGLLASSTVAGLQIPGEAVRRAAGAIAILAAPVAANPISPLSLRNDEEIEAHRKRRHHQHPHNRRQWGWPGWGDDGDDDGDDDEPSPIPTPTPGKGKGGKTKGKSTGVTSGIKSTTIIPTGRPFTPAIPTAKTKTTPSAVTTTLRGKGHPTSAPHEHSSHEPIPTSWIVPTSKHKLPTHTVTVTLKSKSTAPAVSEPTVTVTVTQGAAKSKGIPTPTFATPFIPTPFAPPFGFPGFGDNDN